MTIGSATKRVAFASLGCAKNLVDSEVMIARLGAAGWELTGDAAEADAVVVNTCAFIDPAKAESIDGIVGTGAINGIVEVLQESVEGRRPVRLAFEDEPEHDFLPRLVTTPRATAYLKISEGCDHPCTFCIIPQLRGKFRSRSAESIVREARALVAGGAR